MRYLDNTDCHEKCFDSLVEIIVAGFGARETMENHNVALRCSW